MSVLKVAVASIIALSLVLGLALPALADSGKTLPWTEDFQVRIVKGMVTEVDEENQAYFKVQSEENEVGIKVDENTRYFLLNVQRPIAALRQQFRLRNQEQSGVEVEQTLRLRLHNRVAQTETVPLPEIQTEIIRPSGAEAEFSDIEVGDRVVVWLANGENLARAVLIAKPVTRARVSGVITDVSLETIEITPQDGRPVILRYNEDTVFVLNGFISVEEGQLARAVYDSEHILAMRVVVHLPGE